MAEYERKLSRHFWDFVRKHHSSNPIPKTVYHNNIAGLDEQHSVNLFYSFS